MYYIVVYHLEAEVQANTIIYRKYRVIVNEKRFHLTLTKFFFYLNVIDKRNRYHNNQ